MSDRRGEINRQDITASYRNDESAIPLQRGPEDMPNDTSAGTAFGAGWRLSQDDWPGQSGDVLNQAYGPVIEALRAKTGKPMSSYVWIGQGRGGVNEQAVWKDIVALRAQDREFLKDLPGDREAFSKEVTGRTVQRRARDFGTLNRAEGGAGWAGFGGRIAGAAADPINLMTLPLGGGETIAGRILFQGLAGASIEALEQPMIAVERAKRGETLTGAEAAANIGIAGLGGAAMQGVVVEPLSALFKRTVGLGRATEDEAAAVHVLDREAEVTGTSPYQPGPGAEAHADRLAAVMQGIMANDPPTISRRAELGSGIALSSALPPERLPAIADVSRGTSAPLARDQFMAKVRGAESSGNDLAAAETSTAFGRYQFTKGTWLSYYKRRYGAGGLSDGQILAKRSNGAIQDQLMTDLTADNAAALARIGAPETAGNLYLMHFAGQGGAAKVLRAAEDTPVRDLLRADAIEANPYLRNWTAGELRAWTDRKMGGMGEAGPVVRRDLFTDDADGDALWRAAQDASAAADAELRAIQRERDIADNGGPDIALGRGADFGDPAADEAIAAARRPEEPDLAGMDWEPSRITAADPGVPMERRVAATDSGHDAARVELHAAMADDAPVSPQQVQAMIEAGDRSPALLARARYDEAAAAVNAAFERDTAHLTEPYSRAAHEAAAAGKLLPDQVIADHAAQMAPHRAAQGAAIKALHQRYYREAGGSVDAAPTDILAGYGGPKGLRDRQAAGAAAADAADGRPLPSSMAIAGEAALRDADVSKASEVARMFDDPHGAAAVAMGDGLTHDLRQSLDAGELAEVPFALSGVSDQGGGMAPIYESARAVLDRLDAEDAALAALRACL